MPKSRRRPSAIAITGCVRDITSANKAPGGFGWGEAMKDVLASDTEDTYETYCGKLDVLLADMPDGTSQRIYARGPSSTGQYYGAGNVVAVLSKILGTSASLIGLSPDPRGTPNGLWRMLKDNGKWQPVEWINPPMTLGTEYRTTERYLGKPVYVKLVDLGEGANGKTVNVGTSEMIHVECRATYSSWSLPMPELPFGSTDRSLEHTNAQAFYSDANTVTIIKGSTCPAFTATAKVYYIKSTD